MSSKILFVVSATLSGAASSGPRKDYRVLAEALDATVIDYTSVRDSPWPRLLARVVGMPIAQAWLAFKRRNAYEAILTDGEHIGIPLALMLKISGSLTPHVTIGHRITAAKKRLFFRLLKVQTHISRIALHARAQYDLGTQLGIETDKLTLMPYQVDTDFWRPQPEPEERLICSAGLEFRDYPTLIGAVEGLDVQVVIGAASHWSKRRNTAAGVRQPENVTVDSFDYLALRQLYARASIVVVPLDDTDFQAGVTTILEAMAMGKPVIVTHNQGQTDVVEDRRTVTRGKSPRSRPSSLLRDLADAAGIAMGPTGFYVPPSDPMALRRAIVYLLDHPDERKRLGASGRRAVEQLTTVDQYGSRLRQLIDEVRAERYTYRSGSPRALAGAVGD
ncbi:MAG: glycosyltransferase family 4 protein [Chloroflexota bacterium]|nr:glycosyltransferase family 4 protein [Chloroflexota bacterium]